MAPASFTVCVAPYCFLKWLKNYKETHAHADAREQTLWSCDPHTKAFFFFYIHTYEYKLSVWDLFTIGNLWWSSIKLGVKYFCFFCFYSQMTGTTQQNTKTPQVHIPAATTTGNTSVSATLDPQAQLESDKRAVYRLVQVYVSFKCLFVYAKAPQLSYGQPAIKHKFICAYLNHLVNTCLSSYSCVQHSAPESPFTSSSCETITAFSL